MFVKDVSISRACSAVLLTHVSQYELCILLPQCYKHGAAEEIMHEKHSQYRLAAQNQFRPQRSSRILQGWRIHLQPVSPTKIVICCSCCCCCCCFQPRYRELCGNQKDACSITSRHVGSIFATSKKLAQQMCFHPPMCTRNVILSVN